MNYCAQYHVAKILPTADIAKMFYGFSSRCFAYLLHYEGKILRLRVCFQPILSGGQGLHLQQLP